MVATRSGSGFGDRSFDTMTSGWPSALIRSAARNRRSVIGSVEQRDSTSPLAEVRYSGRSIRRFGYTASIMKSAVCSRSSTARRSPPTVARGTPAVAARPTGLVRRSSMLFGVADPAGTPAADTGCCCAKCCKSGQPKQPCPNRGAEPARDRHARAGWRRKRALFGSDSTFHQWLEDLRAPNCNIRSRRRMISRGRLIQDGP